MKICDLTQFYSPVSGGVRRYLEEKVRYVRDRAAGDRHVLVVPGERDEVRGDGPATVYVVRSRLVTPKSRYRALLRLQRVEEILERERPDLIEAGDPYQLAWKAVLSGRALGIPVVGFYHSHFPEAYLRSVMKYFGGTATQFAMDIARRYVRALYNRFARTLVPSPGLAEVLRSWGVGNVVNIDLGVDTAVFRPDPADGAAARVELGVPPEKLLLLYVGRLAPEKNVRTLLEAFAGLHERYPGRFHLLAVGDGAARTALAGLATRTGAVTWRPYCADPAALARLYRAADLFVHPGVQETFGLVALESQACGTPVVGIRGSYMDRIIFSDQRHWAARNSPEALAEAVAAMGDGDLARSGLEASRTAGGRYSWTVVFERLFGLYREIVAAGPNNRRGLPRGG